MKVFVWATFAVLALLWTGGAAAVAALAQWLAQGLAAGADVDLSRLAEGWVLPGWLAPWIGPDVVAALQDATLAAIELLRSFGPVGAAVVGWLVPLVWLAWGLGLIVLLVLAGIGHGMAHLMRTPSQPAG